MIRTLRKLHVVVYFERENLHTSSIEGELILTILASLAENESRSISENCKWAIRKRFQSGNFKLSRAPYGYRLEDGLLIIEPEEARVVRYIFNCVMNGEGTPAIAEDLNRRGIPTKRGGQWHAGTIQNMIRNVIFKGDLLMQKTWHDSEYRVRINHHEVDQFYYRHHHAPIVSDEVFAAAGDTLSRNLSEKRISPSYDASGTTGLSRKRASANSSTRRTRKYCFSSKIRCGICGDHFIRKKGCHLDGSQAFWACRTHLHSSGSCDAGRIWEDDLKNTFTTVLNKLSYSRDILLRPYIAELGQSDQHASEATELLHFIKSRSKKNPFTAFPEEAFTRFIEYVNACTDGRVTFVFYCGLELTELINRPTNKSQKGNSS